MGTKTEDAAETGATAAVAGNDQVTGAAAEAEGTPADLTKKDAADPGQDGRDDTSADGEEAPEAAGTDDEDPDDTEIAEIPEAAPEEPSFVGQGAAAIVAAVLGLVSLTGGWIGTVASARESLIGQLESSTSSDVAVLVKEGYGDAWNATALYAGAFALVALLVAVVILARPAFGAPGAVQPAWIKSVAWAAVALGVIGLVLAVLKYTELVLGLPPVS
ncbi:hypothetical protein ACFRI7_16660 [Streptomyces sp. NPDC056716]|uniref:hypothetical protein n=1 Tax=unclassified Streptomyces TaxID=2593676 RepID=UPI00369ED058